MIEGPLVSNVCIIYEYVLSSRGQSVSTIPSLYIKQMTENRPSIMITFWVYHYILLQQKLQKYNMELHLVKKRRQEKTDFTLYIRK